MEDLKTSLVPKLNSLQTSQTQAASDISSLTDSQIQISEAVRNLDSLYTKVDILQTNVIEHDLFVDRRFNTLENGIDHLNTGMKHLYYMIKNTHTPTAEHEEFFKEGDDDEDDSRFGERDDVNPDAVAASNPVEDYSTKGEKTAEKEGKNDEVRGSKGGDQGKSQDKGKGKMLSDDDFYMGEQDDFSYDDTEELPGVKESEAHATFDDWEDEIPLDSKFEDELKKQRVDLLRKEDELEKISQVITKKAQLQKQEQQDKQRSHDLKVYQRRVDVRLKVGENWDKARMMFGLPQKSTNNDRDFLHLLDRYRTANPVNSDYMEALRIEVSRIVAAFDRVQEELTIYVYCQKEGSYKVSLNFFENRTLSELWILLNKVCRTSELNELLREHLKEFAAKASPQIIQLPFSVKFLRYSSIQTCNLDQESLHDYPARHLVWIEHMLRTTGFTTQEMLEAADVIQTYCLKNIKKYEQMKNKLKSIRAQPVRPVGHTSERDRVFDQDMLKALELSRQDQEEGEI